MQGARRKQPCGRSDDRITAAWVAGGVLGAMWNAGSDKNYAYPHIRIARFKTSDLSLKDEHAVWNSKFAWAIPRWA